MNDGFFPAALITFREVLEATLIVATVLTVFVKLKQKQAVRVVWSGVVAAVIASIAALIAASFVGLRLQEVYTGRTEELVEGVLMIVSALFVTWAVFFLHTHFAAHKVRLLQKLKKTAETEEKWALFGLVFTAVFREGLEIVLFLSTIYLSASPRDILGGFGVGALLAFLVCTGLFTVTLRFPVYTTFRITSLLLVLFAAGLLARGVHEFAEAGMIPETGRITLAFLPAAQTFAGEMTKALLGLRHTMDVLQLSVYFGYVGFMGWYLLGRGEKASSVAR